MGVSHCYYYTSLAATIPRAVTNIVLVVGEVGGGPLLQLYLAVTTTIRGYQYRAGIRWSCGGPLLLLYLAVNTKP